MFYIRYRSMPIHDEAKLISKTLLACNLSRSKTQRQSRRLKYALNKASLLRISDDWPHNQAHNVVKVSTKMLSFVVLAKKNFGANPF